MVGCPIVSDKFACHWCLHSILSHYHGRLKYRTGSAVRSKSAAPFIGMPLVISFFALHIYIYIGRCLIPICLLAIHDMGWTSVSPAYDRFLQLSHVYSAIPIEKTPYLGSHEGLRQTWTSILLLRLCSCSWLLWKLSTIIDYFRWFWAATPLCGFCDKKRSSAAESQN